MGCGLDKRIALVNRKFHFRPYPPAYPPADEARKHAQNLRLRVPPISAHPPSAPLFLWAVFPIYIRLKDTKQKMPIYRSVHVGALWADGRKWAESGNPHPSYICACLYLGGTLGGTGGMMIPGIVSACTFARGMLSHARKALRTPFPLSQSG